MRIVNKVKTYSRRYLKNKCEVYVMYPEQRRNEDKYNEAYPIKVNPDICVVPEKLKQNFSERIYSGEKCYFVEVSGKVVAYGWRSGTPKVIFYVYEIAGSMQLSTDAYILYDFWVSPEYRRKGIYKNMLQKMISDIGPDGKSVIYAEIDNYASSKAILSVGFQHCGQISFVRKRIII